MLKYLKLTNTILQEYIMRIIKWLHLLRKTSIIKELQCFPTLLLMLGKGTVNLLNSSSFDVNEHNWSTGMYK